MSANALPITPSRFSSALTDLPISSLYAKHAELTNNIAHMQSSNKQLEDFARENDDRDCYEALVENRQVIKRFEERIGLIRKEVVEIRGLPWRPHGGEDEEKIGGAGVIVNGSGQEQAQSEEGNGAGAGDEEEGVYL
jgi:hypothetical protein